MRILMVHNRYQQPGGEDGVVRAEAGLLRAKGHAVELVEEDNDSILGAADAVRTAVQCVWSAAAKRTIEERILEFKPDLVHIHNFFPRLSPSIHFACLRADVPVVQTLHNYRLLCPASTLLRDGHPCEDCLGHAFPWQAIQHRCYRSSRAASAALANMVFVHRIWGTWTRTVTRFIALTEFARAKFSAAGIPADRIAVKPNFVLSDPGMGLGKGGYALFVGRLSEEKGVAVLLDAWNRFPARVPLRIVGDGPLASVVREAAANHPRIEWLGRRSSAEVSALMADAAVLIFPSIWYEGFPLVLAEAFAAGLPVIASRLGAMAEIVTDGKTGLLFSPGRADQLFNAVQWAFAHPNQANAMRAAVRREFEEKYSAEVNYELLLAIYQSACTAPEPRALAQRDADFAAIPH